MILPHFPARGLLFPAVPDANAVPDPEWKGGKSSNLLISLPIIPNNEPRRCLSRRARRRRKYLNSYLRSSIRILEWEDAVGNEGRSVLTADVPQIKRPLFLKRKFGIR